MKKIYLLSFAEFDDPEGYCYYIENKDWFDWIFTNDVNPLPSMVDALWISVQKNKKLMDIHRIKSREDAEKFFDFNKKSGSFENDKALIFGHFCESVPPDKKGLVKWLVKNKFEIEDEYSGMVY